MAHDRSGAQANNAAGEYTLAELCAAASELLASAQVSATDGRVTARPDERVVRYYQSVGLVDRPSRYEGRHAIYGRRHLLQLFLVKAGQAAGSTLAQLQAALAGLSDVDLEVRAGLARLPHPAAQPAGGAAPAPLFSIEVMNGVVITIDPRRVADPAAVAQRMADAVGVTIRLPRPLPEAPR